MSPAPTATRRGIAGELELGEELARADDRAGDQVGEEAEVDRGVDQRGGLGIAALDVDDVGDRLEGEEADPDRQRDRQQRQRHPEGDRVEHVADVGDEEAVVLEDPQREQVEGDRRGADPGCAGERRRSPWISCAASWLPSVIAAQQQAEARIGRRVEDVGGEDDERLPQRRRGISSQESPSTTGKKIANSIVGNSISGCGARGALRVG